LYFVRFVLFCTDAVNDFLDRNCPYVAGAIAFYTLFSLFPLFLAIISVAGFVLGSDAQQNRLARDIADVLPVSTEYIGETVQGVVRARAITGVASILGLLWAASAAFGAIRKGINNAWGIRRTRPFLKERLMDFALVMSAGLLMLVVLFATPTFAFFREVTEALAPDADIASELIWGLLAKLLTPLLSFLTFLMLYRFLPNTKVRLGDVWMVALVASAAFEGAKWGFVWYVTTFPVYNAVYGPVGAIMALLTWVYVSAIILLFGALVTSRYAAFADRVRDQQGLKLVWTGLSRVRLRVVPTTEVA
jgi:membrane protein